MHRSHATLSPAMMQDATGAEAFSANATECLIGISSFISSFSLPAIMAQQTVKEAGKKVPLKELTSLP